jgi:lipid II:glycine glycyltransferase (peptidoglycan interpeptide bridge formation enzyme)
VCLRGPVFDDLDFGQWCLQNIIQYFKKLGVGSVRIGPNWTFPEAEKVESSLFNLGFSIYEKWHEAGRRSTGIIRIDRTDEELLMSFGKSTRYEIRRAERFNVIVRAADNNAEAELFYRHLKNMHKDRGVTCYTTKEFQTMCQSILKDKALGVIFNAYNEGNYLGGLLVLKGASTVHTAKFVVLTEMMMKLNNLRLAPIAFWHGMLWAKERGCRYLDLEGYSSNIEEAGCMKYIYEYKKGFNPTQVCILGQYSIKCNKILFCIHKVCCKIKNSYKKLWRLLFKIRTELINWKIYRKRVQDTHR